MKNENEDIKKDNEEELTSWLGHIKEEVEGHIENLDTDFPLSGGEEPMTAVPDDIPDATEEKDEEEKTSFPKDLDTEFPLSGGEVDR